MDSLYPIFKIDVLLLTDCLSTDLDNFPGVFGFIGVGLKVRSLLLLWFTVVSSPFVD